MNSMEDEKRMIDVRDVEEFITDDSEWKEIIRDLINGDYTVKALKQDYKERKANSMEDQKRFVLTVRQDRTWEVVIHAESEEKAKEQFKDRGIRDEHHYVSDDLVESNTTIASIYRKEKNGE